MMVYHGFPIIFPSFSLWFHDFHGHFAKKKGLADLVDTFPKATKAAATASWSAPCRGCARRDPGCRCNSWARPGDGPRDVPWRLRRLRRVKWGNLVNWWTGYFLVSSWWLMMISHDELLFMIYCSFHLFGMITSEILGDGLVILFWRFMKFHD